VSLSFTPLIVVEGTHRYALLTVSAHHAKACSVTGVPSITATTNLIEHGPRQFPILLRAVAQEDSTHRQKVVVSLHHKAFALVEIVPVTSVSPGGCPSYNTVVVSLPGSKASVTLHASLPQCAQLYVHAFVRQLTLPFPESAGTVSSGV
jgi:hypothetical protein